MSFAEELREKSEPLWSKAVGHRFTQELGADTLSDDVYRHYLIQDYAFLETGVSLVAYGVAKAPDMIAKRELTKSLSILTGEENTYFERAFEALGVPPETYRDPELADVTEEFLGVLRDAGKHGSYLEIIATILPAEWIYFAWPTAQKSTSPKRWYLKEWIDLHLIPDFEAYVTWLKEEIENRAAWANETERAAAEERFRRVVEMEVRFFDAAYDLD